MAATTTAVAGIDNVFPEIWAKDIGLMATDRRIIGKRVEKVPFEGPGDTLRFNKLQDIAASRQTSAAAAQAVMNYIALDAFGTNTVTAQPLQAHAEVELHRNVMKRWLASVEPTLKKRLAISNVNKQEEDLADEMGQVATGFTNTETGAFTLGQFLTAISEIWQNGKDLLVPGNDRLYGIFEPRYWDDIMNEGIVNGGTFLSAAVRGEADGPAKSGMIHTAFGVDIDFTGHIATVGANQANLIFAEGATIFAVKEEPEVLVQQVELMTRIICVSDYAEAVLWKNLGSIYNIPS